MYLLYLRKISLFFGRFWSQSLSHLVGGDRCPLCSQWWGTSISFTLQRQLHGFSSFSDIFNNIGFLFHNLYCKILSINTFNPFLFIRGLSCPSRVQASSSLNCLKPNIPRFPPNCLPVSCGDFGFEKEILCLVLAWKQASKCLFCL